MSFPSRIASDSVHNRNSMNYDHLELLRTAVTEITNLDLETWNQNLNGVENDIMLEEVIKFRYKSTSTITPTTRTRILRCYTDKAVSRQVRLAGLARADLKASLKAQGLYVEPEEALLSCNDFNFEKAINTVCKSPTLETTLAPSFFPSGSSTTSRPLKRTSSFPKSIPDSPTISPTELFKSTSSSYVDEISHCESFFSLARFESEYYKRPRQEAASSPSHYRPYSHSHSHSRSRSRSPSHSHSQPPSSPKLYQSFKLQPLSRPIPQTPRRSRSSISLSYQQSSVFPSSNSTSSSRNTSSSLSTPQSSHSQYNASSRRSSEGHKSKYYQCQLHSCGKLFNYEELLNHRERSHAVLLQPSNPITNRPSTSSPLRSSYVPLPLPTPTPVHRQIYYTPPATPHFSLSYPTPDLTPNQPQTNKYFSR